MEEADLSEGYSYLNSMLDNSQNYSPQQNSSSYLVGNPDVGHTLLPSRRTRAGTMPSLVYMEPSPPPVLVSTPNTYLQTNNRHRSGSLTLPVPSNLNMSNMFHYNNNNNSSNNNNNWHHQPPSEPISPSTEQLLQGDDDFSIARTLRSIGLDEDHDRPRRNRSYSVNNTVMYQDTTATPTRSRINSNNNAFHTPSLESFTPPGNRRRASSMGRMDNPTRLTPPGLSSLWQMQLGTLHDEDYETQSTSTTQEQPSLSLGDSELLANMILPDVSSTFYTTDYFFIKFIYP